MNRLIRSVLAGWILAGASGVAFAEDAAKLYATKCAMCHGKDAKGSASMAKAKKVDNAVLDLVDADSLAKTDEDLILATSEGVGKPSASGAKPMPAYKGKIADADIAALVAYVRTLAPKADAVPAEPAVRK